MFPRSFATLGVACVSLMLTGRLVAQPGFDQTIESDGPLTIIRVEILTQGIDATTNPQEWGRAFEEIGITCRVRQGTREDMPSIAEEVSGEVRRIEVVGILDRQGTITFPDVAFSLAEQVEFRNWFAELERYGIQGSPAGQANWGLDEAQLVELLGHLAQPIEVEVKGLPMGQAIDQLPFPEGMELNFGSGSSAPADVGLAPGPRFDAESFVVNEVRGLSLGTGLAILLAEEGLGFHPRRNPDGSVDLDVISLAGELEPWPIGWDVGDSTPRDQLFPTLFEFFPVTIEDVSLLQTLTVISERSEVPVLIDHRACAARDIDISGIRITVVEEQSAWGLVIRRVVSQARLTFDYRLDEADKGFIWIYPFTPYTPESDE
jgi:hypothetical protein